MPWSRLAFGWGRRADWQIGGVACIALGCGPREVSCLEASRTVDADEQVVASEEAFTVADALATHGERTVPTESAFIALQGQDARFAIVLDGAPSQFKVERKLAENSEGASVLYHPCAPETAGGSLNERFRTMAQVDVVEKLDVAVAHSAPDSIPRSWRLTIGKKFGRHAIDGTWKADPREGRKLDCTRLIPYWQPDWTYGNFFQFWTPGEGISLLPPAVVFRCGELFGDA